MSATKLSHTAPIDLYAEWVPAAADMVYVPEAGLSVPKGWLETWGGAQATTDAEWLAAARAQAANGRPLWACYAAGLDPKDPQDDVRVTAIAIDDGEAHLEYERRARCVYEEEGRPTLTEGVWRRRKTGDRFFRVRVHK